MNCRINKAGVYGVLALVLVAVVIFGYTLVSAPTGTEEPGPNDVTTVEQTTLPANVTLIAQHQYVDGLHTIAGTVDLPTPCHRLTAEPFFLGESRDAVEVRFTTSIEGEVCAQVITPARFKVTFEANEEARITALYNGAPAELQLVPVPEGVNLDDFELFIKG